MPPRQPQDRQQADRQQDDGSKVGGGGAARPAAAAAKPPGTAWNSFAVLAGDTEAESQLQEIAAEEDKRRGGASSSSGAANGRTNGGRSEGGPLKQPLVWIDLEMTGLEAESDQILQIAVICTGASGIAGGCRQGSARPPPLCVPRQHGMPALDAHTPLCLLCHRRCTEADSGGAGAGHPPARGGAAGVGRAWQASEAMGRAEVAVAAPGPVPRPVPGRAGAASWHACPMLSCCWHHCCSRCRPGLTTDHERVVRGAAREERADAGVP